MKMRHKEDVQETDQYVVPLVKNNGKRRGIEEVKGREQRAVWTGEASRSDYSELAVNCICTVYGRPHIEIIRRVMTGMI